MLGRNAGLTTLARSFPLAVVARASASIHSGPYADWRTEVGNPDLLWLILPRESRDESPTFLTLPILEAVLLQVRFSLRAIHRRGRMVAVLRTTGTTPMELGDQPLGGRARP